MGVFSKDYEKEAEELWKDVEKNLMPKDGLKHVLSIVGQFEISKSTIKAFACTDICNIKINTVVKKMQENGYNIIDIKLSVISSFSVAFVIIYE